MKSHVSKGERSNRFGGFSSEPLGPISIPTPRRHTCFCFVHVPFPKGWPSYCATFALQKVWLKLSWCAKIGFLQSALYCICFITRHSFLFVKDLTSLFAAAWGRYKLRSSFSLPRSFTVLLPYVLPVDSSTRQRYQGPGSGPSLLVRVTFAKPSNPTRRHFRNQLGPSWPKLSEES